MGAILFSPIDIVFFLISIKSLFVYDMNISIRVVRINRTPQLDEIIEKKIQTLDRYLKDIKDIAVEIIGDAHHKKGGVVRVEIMLHLLKAGSTPLRVEEVASDIHEALDIAVATMKKNIATYKGKKSLLKKDLVRTVQGKE